MKTKSRRYTVNVTQANIDLAKTYKDKHLDPDTHCPIALALKKQFKKKVSVNYSNDISIAGKQVKVLGKKKQTQVDTFIDNFDYKRHHRCKPFSFEIEREPAMADVG